MQKGTVNRHLLQNPVADDFLAELFKIKNVIFRRGKKGSFLLKVLCKNGALQTKGDFLISLTVQKKGGFFLEGLSQQRLCEKGTCT